MEAGATLHSSTRWAFETPFSIILSPDNLTRMAGPPLCFDHTEALLECLSVFLFCFPFLSTLCKPVHLPFTFTLIFLESSVQLLTNAQWCAALIPTQACRKHQLEISVPLSLFSQSLSSPNSPQS